MEVGRISERHLLSLAGSIGVIDLRLVRNYIRLPLRLGTRTHIVGVDQSFHLSLVVISSPLRFLSSMHILL